jgi:TRAP-type C4-dicarboxylate transport system permease large subunit
MVPLGMMLDSISIVLVFIPIVFPIVEAMDYSGVWFGILAVKLIEIGLVTPPVGMNVFVVAASVPGVTAEQVFRGVVPFIAADVVMVALLLAVPGIVLFLPGMIGA